MAAAADITLDDVADRLHLGVQLFIDGRLSLAEFERSAHLMGVLYDQGRRDPAFLQVVRAADEAQRRVA